MGQQDNQKSHSDSFSKRTGRINLTRNCIKQLSLYIPACKTYITLEGLYLLIKYIIMFPILEEQWSYQCLANFFKHVLFNIDKKKTPLSLNYLYPLSCSLMTIIATSFWEAILLTSSSSSSFLAETTSPVPSQFWIVRMVSFLISIYGLEFVVKFY